MIIKPILFRHLTQRLDGRRSSLVVERRTLEREVGGSILTRVAVLYP